MNIKLGEILPAFMVLFAVIDIIGTIPIIINIKNKGGVIKPFQASFVSLAILIAFLFIGEAMLKLFGVDISSFAIAGSFILFFMALEMILGIDLFRHDAPATASIVPIAFPIVAGAGSFTTLLSLRAEYQKINIIIALVLNIFVVYLILRSTDRVEKILGETGQHVIKKFFGIILLAISVKLFMSNIAILMHEGLPQP